MKLPPSTLQLVFRDSYSYFFELLFISAVGSRYFMWLFLLLFVFFYYLHCPFLKQKSNNIFFFSASYGFKHMVVLSKLLIIGKNISPIKYWLWSIPHLFNDYFNISAIFFSFSVPKILLLIKLAIDARRVWLFYLINILLYFWLMIKVKIYRLYLLLLMIFLIVLL